MENHLVDFGTIYEENYENIRMKSSDFFIIRSYMVSNEAINFPNHRNVHPQHQPTTRSIFPNTKESMVANKCHVIWQYWVNLSQNLVKTTKVVYRNYADHKKEDHGFFYYLAMCYDI